MEASYHLKVVFRRTLKKYKSKTHIECVKYRLK